MRAALLTEINKPLEIHELAPCDLEYGQVYVRVLLSGICGKQLQEIRGEDKCKFFPRLMGHEGVGIVERVGPGVKHVAVQDRVCLHWRKGAGIECEPPKYWPVNTWRGKDEDAPITGGQLATFATHSICSENRLTKIPCDTPDELAALLGCGLSTAIGTIEDEANLHMGESVLIIGCGGLGLNLIMAARMRRAGYIFSIDKEECKRQLALIAGADDFCLSHIGRHRAFPGCNVVIDTTGDSMAIADGFKCLAPSGRMILVGQPHHPIMLKEPLRMFSGDGQSIRATQGGRFRPHIDLPRYARLKVDTSKIVTDTVPLSDINWGINLVATGRAGRVMVKCNDR